MPKIILDFPHNYTEKEMDAFAEMFEDKGYEPHPDRPLPFDCKIYDKEAQKIENKLGGGSCYLEPDAIAVYDTIKGAEMLGNYETVQDGCEWFRKYFPEEYMILLD